MESVTGKRVLMALTRFDIGGAETHVLELSLELQRMGFHVVVVSNGGVYEKNLAEAGIPHYQIPLQSKSPQNIIKSLRLLSKVIRDEKIDIVHAHGRIPAFLCGLLKKVKTFTFVTTAHWVFDTSHGLKYISNWGEKVIAVSEDIKTYLMDNYHTNPADIYVTINGIDTEKFCKNADYASVISEFSLSETSKKIVYISRMDEDRARVAFELVEIAPRLTALCPDLEIVIVGGGNVFSKLEEKTEEINRAIGRRAVVLTGARTDIYKFAALGDVFVGVSRSALEAMACEKPVIVAGNEGYIGIFDESKLDVSIDTNFCCRGLEMSSCERLFSDLALLLSASDEENARLGTYGRNLILNNYSLSKMAQDCVKMYTAAVDSKKWDAVISGYYGYENSGDEALLYAMLENLRSEKDDVRVLVLSKKPEETEAKYGVHAVNRYHLFKIRKALRLSRLFIFGGGSLIQDVTSNKSLWYYLTVISMAIKNGVSVMLYANGIGPVQKEKNRKKVRDILNKADIISLRDSDSLDEIKRMGIDLSRVKLTADPALTVKASDEKTVRAMLAQEGVLEHETLLGISVRSWKACKPSYWESLAKGIETICKQYGYVPVFIPLKLPEDIAVSRELAEKMNIKSYVLTNPYNANEMVGIAGACEMMIAMRLHAIIYAATANVPAIGLSYDPKVQGFVNYIGVNTTLTVEELSEDALISIAQDMVSNRDALKNALQDRVTQLQEKAMDNAKMAMDLMK